MYIILIFPMLCNFFLLFAFSWKFSFFLDKVACPFLVKYRNMSILLPAEEKLVFRGFTAIRFLQNSFLEVIVWTSS
jgi:hypothetical protein